jgi:hypothetical protein
MRYRQPTLSTCVSLSPTWSAISYSLVAVMAIIIATGCRPVALTEQLEARRLAADMHVQFTKATEAANRAVMADTDEASASAAREARDGAQSVERDLKELQPILTSLGYTDELRDVEAFDEAFGEYRELDDEILPLAVENSNVKAQRLSFGPARQASDEFRRSLDAAVRAATPPSPCCADALASKATAALLDIQVLHAPHIAEAEDAAMTRMEEQMAASEAVVQKTLDDLKRLLGAKAGGQLTAATAAFDRFKETHREIITLSRRNSDVRSLALSLGRKRMVTAAADDQLRALEETLSRRGFTATR